MKHNNEVVVEKADQFGCIHLSAGQERVLWGGVETFRGTMEEVRAWEETQRQYEFLTGSVVYRKHCC